MMTIDELLIDFDEIGFIPTTLCENPDEYAQDWIKQLLVEIKRLKAENKQLKTECALLDDELCIARQETINVLNKLKSKCHNYYPSIDHYCCSVKAVNLSDIYELLKEYEE
jgi:hypothetical protein